MSRVLILGSAPCATEAANWGRDLFDHVVVINNAWRVRSDWSHLIHPEDFPVERRPGAIMAGQQVITAAEYVPTQNTLGGFVYAGGTMAFTAGYWVLAALAPREICYFGCDMVYPKAGSTHFYGTGAADPLREDVTLASLPAKARRLQALAAERDCAVVNLSPNESVLPYPRYRFDDLSAKAPQKLAKTAVEAMLQREAELGYYVPSGRYWQEEDRFDQREIGHIDQGWLDLFAEEMALSA